MRLSLMFYMNSVPLTEATITGQTSLGGSESACVMLAEALAARGHDVHIFATQLEKELTHKAVTWHDADALGDVLKLVTPDVFCSLRMPLVFHDYAVPAALNLLWNQDLLIDAESQVVPYLSTIDRLVYVSAFHRDQWAEKNALLGGEKAWLTRNCFDPASLPDLRQWTKARHRFIYVSRPERALEPLLKLWPRIRERYPDAELGVCRYQSMYDGEGSNVARMCQRADEAVARVHAKVGGITNLGQLTKPQLYREIARARLMLYPGVADFAETSCIAAIEAQACGTPLVASWKGALPETLHPDAGVLVGGPDSDALSAEYQDEFFDAVTWLVDDDTHYEAMREAGRAHVLPGYTAAAVAEQWERDIEAFFRARYAANKPAVMRQLMHWDNHVAAQMVADEIVAEVEIGGDVSPSDAKEAHDAAALCRRVIDQQEQTAEHYAKYAAQDVLAEMELNTRLQIAADILAERTPRRVLDVACGNGTLSLLLASRLPDVQITAVDYAPGVLALARAAADELGVSDRVTFREGGWESIEGEYDAVFCGEFIEHIPEPWRLLDRLESHCAPNGRVLLTTPCGPFYELLAPGVPRQRGHLHAFTHRDISEMCAQKRDFAFRYLGVGDSPRGTPTGYWLFAFSPGGGPAQPLDYVHTLLTTRPYQRLVATIIVKDAANWIRGCLESITAICDRVVVFDTGSTDGTPALIRGFEIPQIEVVQATWPDDFSAARNAVLGYVEADTEWVLWIDADERMIHPERVRKHLSSASPFLAYVVRQNHMMIDHEPFADRPCRIFRTGQGIKFYGAVHEQPETAPDAGIWPSLELPGTDIAHYGYPCDDERREKMLRRNLPLLRKALGAPTPRQLDWVLAMRDYANLAQFEIEGAGGLTSKARDLCHAAISCYRDPHADATTGQPYTFTDPTHKYHELARGFYQAALGMLRTGIEVEWAFGAAPGKLRGSVKPERFRAWDADEAEREVAHKTSTWLAQLRPTSPRVAPAVTRNGDGGWGMAAHDKVAAPGNGILYGAPDEQADYTGPHA